MKSLMTEFQGLMRDSSPIDALNRLTALQEFNNDNVIVLMNTGLHPLVTLTFDQQKRYFDTFYNYTKSHESSSKKVTLFITLLSINILTSTLKGMVYMERNLVSS